MGTERTHNEGTAAISQRGAIKAAGRRTRRGVLLLVLPAALALSGCVATPQPGITDSGTPTQTVPGPAPGVTTTTPASVTV